MGASLNKLMAEYNIGSSTLYDIKKQKESLCKFYSGSAQKSVEKQKNLCKPKMDQLDQVLYEWFKVKRSEGKSNTWPILFAKAKDFCDQIGITEACSFSHVGWHVSRNIMAYTGWTLLVSSSLLIRKLLNSSQQLGWQ